MPHPRNRKAARAVFGQHSPVLMPSLLACDFGRLRDEVQAIEATGVHGLHLDVMDGHFVPNLSFGLPIVETVRAMTELPLDVHLMINNPAQYAMRYRQAGADIVTVHTEVLDDPRPLLDEIRGSGAMAGLSLNPPTPLEQILPALPHCDLVLVMSVMPGFGGQEFNAVALDKLSRLKENPACDALLEVDGGVNASTIQQCVQAGADLLVAGTAVFDADDYQQRVDHLNELARSPGEG